MVQKTTFFRFQAVLASKLAPTWVPKTGPKPTQNLTNRLQISTSLQDAPKMAPNLEKHPKICKNLQKCYQHGRIMGPKFYQNPCQKRLQGELSWESKAVLACVQLRGRILRCDIAPSPPSDKESSMASAPPTSPQARPLTGGIVAAETQTRLSPNGIGMHIVTEN